MRTRVRAHTHAHADAHAHAYTHTRMQDHDEKKRRRLDGADAASGTTQSVLDILQSVAASVESDSLT